MSIPAMAAGFQRVAGSQADLTGRSIGRFLIRSRLGKGGMGEVYLAEDTGLKRPVAIKRVPGSLHPDSSSRRRLWHEAERASRLNDSHVAAVYDVIEDRDDVFLVMEYVQGETLRQRMSRSLPLHEFLPIAEQCAMALAAAHKAGLLHRDIKPENFMLTPSGEVKTLDFGVARELPRSGTATTLETLEHSGFQGTLAYMAPEILEEKEPDARADLFSLGVVFYEALAGKHPFLRTGFVDTCEAILHHAPPPLTQQNPQVGAELDRIVSKMLAKQPEDRYATAADLVVDLRAVARTSQIPQVPPQAAKLPWMKLPYTIVVSALALILVIAAAAALPSIGAHVRNWLGITSIPREKHVAVLQFRSVESDPGVAPFTAGLSDTLTAKLTQLTSESSLQVVPASEIQNHHVTTVEQARAEFGVNLVVDGSLAKVGDLVRVNYALIDPRTSRQLQADTITVSATNAFAVQDQVVDGVLSMLELEIRPTQRQILQAHGTELAAAYHLYLEGTGYLDNYDRPENLDKAIGDFQQALQLDPGYAVAYASLGSAYWKKYESGKDVQWIARTRDSCEKALNLDNKIAAGHICLGTLETGTGSYDTAVHEFQMALDAEPTSDEAYRGLAYAYEGLGKSAEAEKTYRRAIDLRPQYWAGYSWLGAFLYHQARYDDAARAFQRVTELTPDSFRGYSNLGQTFNELGRYPDAIRVLQRSIAIRPTSGAYSNLGNAYFYLRRYAESVGPYEQAVKLDKEDSRLWRNLADAYYWAPEKRTQAPAAYKQAISLAERETEVNPRDVEALATLAISNAMIGDRNAARAFLHKVLTAAPAGPDAFLIAALVYNQFGDDTKTLEWLKKSRTAGISATEINDTPDFDHLHSDQRFQQICEQR